MGIKGFLHGLGLQIIGLCLDHIEPDVVRNHDLKHLQFMRRGHAWF